MRWAVVPLVSGKFAILDWDEFLGRNRMILGSKFKRFHGRKVEKIGEMLDPLVTKQVHGSNAKKIHRTNKSQKKNWGYFWWGFSKLGKNTTKLG